MFAWSFGLKKKKLGKVYDWHGLRCLALDLSVRVRNFVRSLRNTKVGRFPKAEGCHSQKKNMVLGWQNN